MQECSGHVFPHPSIRYFGLGLYNSPLGLLLVEGGLWLAGIVLYVRATRARGLAGHLVLWIGVAIFTALWLLSFNGAPPPSMRLLVIVDLILFPVLLAWLYWVDSLRPPKEQLS